MSKIESPCGNADILYEDDCVIALSKPHGLHVVSDRNRSEQNTLKSLLAARYGKIFVVHRLDAGA